MDYNSALALFREISAPAGQKDKNHILYTLDALIKAVKLKSIA